MSPAEATAVVLAFLDQFIERGSGPRLVALRDELRAGGEAASLLADHLERADAPRSSAP
jgi:hypothetical protein